MILPHRFLKIHCVKTNYTVDLGIRQTQCFSNEFFYIVEIHPNFFWASQRTGITAAFRAPGTSFSILICLKSSSENTISHFSNFLNVNYNKLQFTKNFLFSYPSTCLGMSLNKSNKLYKILCPKD